MFESGHHSNIFDKDLGKPKHDKEIKAKKDKLTKIQEAIDELKKEKAEFEKAINDGNKKLISQETQLKIIKDGMEGQEKVDKDREYTLEKLTKEQEILEKELKENTEERKERNSKLTGLQKELDKVESKAFEKFCSKLKISDISEYEGVNIKIFEENSRQKQSLQDDLNKIKFQIDQLGIEQTADANKMLEDEQNDIQSKLEEAESQRKEIEENIKQERDRFEIIEREFNATRDTIEREERSLEKDQTDLELTKKKIQDLEKMFNEAKHKLKAVFMKFLKNLVMRGTMTDKKAGKMYEKVDLEATVVKLNKQIIEVEYDVDENLKLDVETASENSIKAKMNELNKALQQKEKIIEDYERVAMLAPECKKELGLLKKKITELREKNEEEEEGGKESSERLMELRQMRGEALSDLISVLDDRLSPIYQFMTKKSEIMFGTSTLMVENKKTPFNGTINFIANPPGKRNVYDIQQLSSGEKTMAVLSFIFTLIKYCGLPFVIFDEADAHLDDSHIEKIIEYIKTKLNKQCIFVSHKMKTMEASDSLVGITNQAKNKTSAAFSYDFKD